MKILMVASEAAPFAKTGGLADVLGALPAALVNLGDDVAVVIPKYQSVLIEEARRVWNYMPLSVGPAMFTANIDEVVREGVRYFFVDCPQLYSRAGIYGDALGAYPDNHIRFAALTQAALGIARHIFRPEVFHCHDWQTGLLPHLLKTAFTADPAFMHARSVFTIHNLGYQGNFGGTAIAELGLDPVYDQPEGYEFFGQLSFMKAGLMYADAITTVSPTYAREIQTLEHGFGMDGVLRNNAHKLTGILNGVDYSVWSPEVDPHLASHYSAADLAGKLACKRGLLREMGLPENDARPLIGIVSRFAEQKGFNLILDIAEWLMEQDVALAILGSGDVSTQDAFRALAEQHPTKLAVRVGYADALSHRIEGGSDMFLMPSRYEPCGLNQIYSLRYGTVPIVRATGGLADTVDSSTGFVFEEFTGEALQGAVTRALQAFANRSAWTERILRGMAKDYSWNASAQAYRELYQAHHTVAEHS
ncbi:MAG: glycogen synthase GlgA [Bryobacteraceae bacterium]